MSFLNPVNEPVLRFSSTDADAPQINYAARTAGDVKAVLKACLVTGYGAKASAGWTAVNETATVIEFVSPSVAMSDYRLGIDDTSTSTTTWYYQYQNVRVNPVGNALKKSFSYINKTHASNGWQLIVTQRGIYFVEVLYATDPKNTATRVTYWGAIKSALLNATGENISYWSVGYGAPISEPYLFFDAGSSGRTHYRLAGYTQANLVGASVAAAAINAKTYGVTTIDLVSDLFLRNGDVMLGQQSGLMLQDINLKADAYGVADLNLDGRPVLKAPINLEYSGDLSNLSRILLIRLDYWEC